MSRKPGPASHDPFSRSTPPRTRGPLGRNDAGDPDAKAKLGDTPGSLGVNDGASKRATGGGPLAVRMLQSMMMGATPDGDPPQLRKWVDEVMIYDVDDDLCISEAKDFLSSYQYGGWTVGAEGVRNITQTSEALTRYTHIKQITFNTHGSPGAAWVSNSKGIPLDTDALSILPIPRYLFAGEGRLLFFGCNIAEFKKGEDFLVAAGKHFFRGKGGVVGGTTVANVAMKYPWQHESVARETFVPLFGESSEVWFHLPILGNVQKRRWGELVLYRLDADGNIIANQRVTPGF